MLLSVEKYSRKRWEPPSFHIFRRRGRMSWKISLSEYISNSPNFYFVARVLFISSMINVLVNMLLICSNFIKLIFKITKAIVLRIKVLALHQVVQYNKGQIFQNQTQMLGSICWKGVETSSTLFNITKTITFIIRPNYSGW